MTQHDFEHIDRLLREEATPGSDDDLYVRLMAVAPRPDPAFVNRLEARLTRPQSGPERVSRRLRWVGALVALCLLTVSVALAIDGLLGRALDSDAGLRAARQEGRGSTLNLVQQSGPFSVTIEWGYADRQRVALGYVIQAHDARSYANLGVVEATLVLADETRIPLRVAGLHLVEGNQAAGRLEAEVGDMTLPAELEGALSLQVAYSPQPVAVITAVASGGPSPILPPLEERLLKTPPMTFAVRLPVEGGYAIWPDLTAQDAGLTLHLREFRLAPSQGEAVVCFTPPPHPEEEMWVWDVQVATLTYNGAQVVAQASGRYDAGCAEVRLVGDLPLEAGRWTLTIGEVRGTRTRLPDGPELEATVRAAGGEVYEMVDGLGSFWLPEGADEAIGWSQRIRGVWRFTFETP